MADLDAPLAATRAAVDELIAAAHGAEPIWTTPRAPGKWSPSQVVEHVARALEESAKTVSGVPDKLPHLPRLLRPLARRFLLARVLRNGTIPKAKTIRAMDPEHGPPTPAEGRARLEDALARFDEACRARAAETSTMDSGFFGTIPLADYARFQELHTRHHTRQIPTS